jgi:hypothetical protein
MFTLLNHWIRTQLFTIKWLDSWSGWVVLPRRSLPECWNATECQRRRTSCPGPTASARSHSDAGGKTRSRMQFRQTDHANSILWISSRTRYRGWLLISYLVWLESPHLTSTFAGRRIEDDSAQFAGGTWRTQIGPSRHLDFVWHFPQTRQLVLGRHQESHSL